MSPVISDPFTFADGPGNTASGIAVNQRFNRLYNLVNGTLDAANLAAGAVTAPKLAVLPACRAYLSGAGNFSNATLTTVDFLSERFDTDAIFTATAPTKLTCKTAGIYLITGAVQWQNNNVGERYLDILLNNATVVAADRKIAASTTEHTISTIYQLAVNDYVEMRAYQSSGGILALTGNGNYGTEFGMAFLTRAA